MFRFFTLLAVLFLAACGRTNTYAGWLAGLRPEDGGSVGGGMGGGGGGAGGGGMGGGHEIPPGCAANEVRYIGEAPVPAPAGIPRLQAGILISRGITASAPWFDWSTALIAGTADKAGEVRLAFEGVTLWVRIDAGDNGAAIANRLVRCGRVPGYRFEIETPAAPHAFIGVRRADCPLFTRIFAENSHADPRFVFEDNEGIPYWLSILRRPGDPPLLLSARGKPICGGGAKAREPTEKKLKTKDGVLFSWDGTHFTDGGACLERQVFDAGTAFLIACARVTQAAPGADPFTRPDGGFAVDCLSQQAVLGPMDPGAPVAIVFNW